MQVIQKDGRPVLVKSEGEAQFIVTTERGLAQMVAKAAVLGSKASEGLTSDMISVLIASEIRNTDNFACVQSANGIDGFELPDDEAEKRSEPVTAPNTVDLYFASLQPKAFAIPQTK
jgi:hypothetical protein